MLARRRIREAAINQISAIPNSLINRVSGFFSGNIPLDWLPHVNVSTSITEYSDHPEAMRESNPLRTLDLTFEITTAGLDALVDAESIALEIEQVIPTSRLIAPWVSIISIKSSEIEQGHGAAGVDLGWAKITQTFECLFLQYGDRPGPWPGDDPDDYTED